MKKKKSQILMYKLDFFFNALYFSKKNSHLGRGGAKCCKEEGGKLLYVHKDNMVNWTKVQVFGVKIIKLWQHKNLKTMLFFLLLMSKSKTTVLIKYWKSFCFVCQQHFNVILKKLPFFFYVPKYEEGSVVEIIWKCCREYGSAAEGMEVLPRVWKCCREHESAVESMEVLSRVRKCCRE